MRIHIVCPSDEVNGSAESLHQFGRAAATLGYDVRIAYSPDADVYGPVVSAFRSYGLRHDQQIADNPDDIHVVPHGSVDLVAECRNAKTLVWWLRLDDDMSAADAALAVPNAVHLAQSEHVRRFLSSRGVSASLVGDYVHANFIARAEALAPEQRLNNVLYRPDASDALTPKLMAAAGDVLTWVPVAGLPPTDVAELLAYCSVYVDFGSFDGATRLPREAIAAGCCVITGTRGAASTGLGVDVPDDYRIDESAVDAVERALNRIALTLMEPTTARSDFAPAREVVKAQEAQFRETVAAVIRDVLVGSGASDSVRPRAVLRTARTTKTVTPAPVVRPARSGGLVPGVERAPEIHASADSADLSISVVIATIPPRAKLLRRALDSVAAQTAPPTAVIVEWDHARTGAAATKNRGIDKVTTEWVAMLDDDDMFLPEHLELLHRCAVETGADVVYSIPRAEKNARPVPELRFGKPFDAAELRRAPYIPNTVLMRADLVRKVEGYECAPGTVWDDYGLFLKLLEVGASFVHLPEVTWVWNQVGQGTAGVPTAW